MAKASELTSLAPDGRSRRLSSEPLRYRDLTKPRTLTYGRHSTDVISQVVWRLQKSAWRVYQPSGFRCVRNRETGRFNGQTFWQFLKMFQEASAVPGQRVLAISDNAQYHRSKLHREWRDHQAPQFGLDFLPPYSPELNPIERAWKLTRRLCLHNRYFGFLESVEAAVEDQFVAWAQPNDTLRRLCVLFSACRAPEPVFVQVTQRGGAASKG